MRTRVLVLVDSTRAFEVPGPGPTRWTPGGVGGRPEKEVRSLTRPGADWWRCAEEIGDLGGQAIGGVAPEADGQDDGALPPAETDHPCPLGRPVPGAGRADVDLEADRRLLYPPAGPVGAGPAGGRAEPGRAAGASIRHRLAAARPGAGGRHVEYRNATELRWGAAAPGLAGSPESFTRPGNGARSHRPPTPRQCRSGRWAQSHASRRNM